MFPTDNKWVKFCEPKDENMQIMSNARMLADDNELKTLTSVWSLKRNKITTTILPGRKADPLINGGWTDNYLLSPGKKSIEPLQKKCKCLTK